MAKTQLDETSQKVYKAFREMEEVRNAQYRQFNDRTLVQFIDDSEKRANSYTPNRDTQNKADWQANFFHPTTRNKLRAIIASVTREVPEAKIVAISKKDEISLQAASIIKGLVKFSRLQSNIELENFFDVWEACVKGTIVKYEGYLKTVEKRGFIKSFNQVTGDVEKETEDVLTNDKCFEELVNLEELYISDAFLFDIQDQPAMIWKQVLKESDFKREFSRYSNFKKVEPRNNITKPMEESVFYSEWKDRLQNDQYEVLKYYSIPDDEYIIIVNGIKLLEVPMLWGRSEKKYPFAKTIFEPFTGKNFFYGNSLPNSILGEQDVINSLYNMMIDKTYRSLVKPLLIGASNIDAFDLEDEIISHDTKIQVEDVSQVKQLEIEGVNGSELQAIELINASIEQSTVDQVQQGVSGSGSTAREIVIANENAKRLRTIFLMFLADLWKQKTELRVINIIMNYTLPKVNLIDKEAAETFKTFLIPDSELSDGKTGTLKVEVGDTKIKPEMLDAREEMARNNGVELEHIVISPKYLDEYQFQFTVKSDNVFRADRAENQALFQEKIQIMATLFPEEFQSNKQVIFKEFIEAYDDDSNKYQVAPPQQMQQGAPGEQQGPGGQQQGAQALPAMMDALAKKQ